MARAFRPPSRGVARLLVVALLLAQAVVLVGAASPARAASCSGWTKHAESRVAKTHFAWGPQCDDGSALIFQGVLYDTNCDGRDARVWFNVFDKRADGSYARISTTDFYKVANGCGNSASLPSIRVNSPGSLGWKLDVKLYACNLGSCSSTYTRSFTG